MSGELDPIEQLEDWVLNSLGGGEGAKELLDKVRAHIKQLEKTAELYRILKEKVDASEAGTIGESNAGTD